MPGTPHETWKDLLTWTFKGPRFEDQGVELNDLRRLVALRELLVETAKEIWKRENPDRERLPRNFEERIELKIFRMLPGSVTVPIRYRNVEPHEPKLPFPDAEEPREIIGKLRRAARVTVQAVRAAGSGRALPSEFPRPMLSRFDDLTGNLRQGDEIELTLSEAPDEPPARLSRDTGALLVAEAQPPWDDAIDVVGEVTAASLKGQATIDVDGAPIEIRFSPDQEKLVTRALYEHERVRLRVIGRGTFDPPRGRLKRIATVDSLTAMEGPKTKLDPNARAIWEAIAEISATVPDSEWEKLPRDGAANVDHYLYGAPKDPSEAQ